MVINFFFTQLHNIYYIYVDHKSSSKKYVNKLMEFVVEQYQRNATKRRKNRL